MTGDTPHSGIPGLGTVRQLWQLLEPVHPVVSHTPESYEEAGAPRRRHR
ncbi:hypothetical protein AB0I68_10910 [Streptomyces sp. NPDC050448]